MSDDNEKKQAKWPSSLYAGSERKITNSLLRTETDYHFRTSPPLKKYKFTQKLRRRPRLRIRKNDEVGLLRGNATAQAKRPLRLPHLAPINSMDSFEVSSTSSFKQKFPLSSKVKTLSSESISNGPNSKSDVYFGESGLTPYIEKNRALPPNYFEEQDFKVIGGSNFNNRPPMDDSTSGLEESENVGAAEDLGALKTVVSDDSSAAVAPPKPSSWNDLPSVSGEFEKSGQNSESPTFGTQGSGIAARENQISVPTPMNRFGSEKVENGIDASMFTGDTAFETNHKGPTGDGFGPPILSGAAIPPPVPAVNFGGAAAGIPPYPVIETTENPPTTLKASALLSALNRADIGFNQAMSHLEHGTPVEAAAIDILEVALGSEKLDSQAKLLSHIDRTIGIDNLQRLQRWANTGGALDTLKEQLVKIANNYNSPKELLPTVPPQLQYLFSSRNQ